MKFSVILFLVSTSTGLAVSGAVKTLLFPTETDVDHVELTPLKPLNLTAFTLCMRVATELSGTREVILFAYRISANDELNVWREMDGRLSLYLSSHEHGVSFNVPELGALETHLCVTWNSISGAATIFMNGRKSLTKIYKQGHKVQPGGIVVLGQDLDSKSGKYYAKQSFVGEIGDVNMWDYVLSDSTIQHLYTGMEVPDGNVFDWKTIELKPSGGVVVIERKL